MKSIEEQVEQYLADCAAHPRLAKKYHPTWQGCVKMIPHAGDKEVAAEIRATFEKLNPPASKQSPRPRRPGRTQGR